MLVHSRNNRMETNWVRALYSTVVTVSTVCFHLPTCVTIPLLPLFTLVSCAPPICLFNFFISLPTLRSLLAFLLRLPCFVAKGSCEGEERRERERGARRVRGGDHEHKTVETEKPVPCSRPE